MENLDNPLNGTSVTASDRFLSCTVTSKDRQGIVGDTDCQKMLDLCRYALLGIGYDPKSIAEAMDRYAQEYMGWDEADDIE